MSAGAAGHVVNARIVYWGVEGAGKTTNLERIHGKLRPDHRGPLRRQATPEDPSVHFEVMPIELGEISGVRTRLQIMALPGGAEHVATRKQLLDQVDGVVFVLDARRERLSDNLAALEELRSSLAAYGRSLEQIPVVLQYNRRDEADDLAVEELHRKIGLRAAAFEAIATRGMGVLESLTTISKRVVRNRREAAGLTLPPGSTLPPGGVTLPPSAPTPAIGEATQPSGTSRPPAPVVPPSHGDLSFGSGSTLPTTDQDSTLPEEEKTHPGDRTLPEPEPDPHDSVAQAIDTAARRAERVFDDNWDAATGGFDGRTGADAPLELSIVAAGDPVVESERRLRLPLRVVDQDGREGELLVTLDLRKPDPA